MKKIIFAALLFISSCSPNTPISVITIPDTSPMWRQFGNDARHTGNPNSQRVLIPPVVSGSVEWCDTVTTGVAYDGTDCSVDSKGNIYFLSPLPGTKARVIKYNFEGKKMWERDTLNIDGFFGLAISTDESRIYYSDFSNISCRDSAGNLLWRINERGVGSPIIDNENNIYLNNGFLTKISSDGNKLWTLPEINGIVYSPVFDRDFNIYFPGIKNDHNVLVKVNKTGSVLWTYDFNNYMPNSSRSPIIDGYGNIFYSHDKLYCISKEGSLKWEKPFGSETTPAITNNNNLVVKSSGGFTMLDTSGTIVWSINIGINSNQSYIVLDDEDNLYYNYYTPSFLSIISLNKSGGTRWNLQNFTNGLVIPGPALSPLARIITYPKRPARIYSIK